MNKKRILRIAIGLALAAVACIGIFVACIVYINWSAERRAREFCNMIPIGSAISAATARATDRNILWGSEGGYVFYFPGIIFDKAICEVSVDKEKNVTSKRTEMEYD